MLVIHCAPSQMRSISQFNVHIIIWVQIKLLLKQDSVFEFFMCDKRPLYRHSSSQQHHR